MNLIGIMPAKEGIEGYNGTSFAGVRFFLIF